MDKKNARPSKAESSAQNSADSTRQGELFKKPRTAPQCPVRGSKAWLAMLDLARHGALTQPDWLILGRGWRLAAAVKELGYLDWSVIASWVQPEGYPNPIKRYCLSTSQHRLATHLAKGVL